MKDLSYKTSFDTDTYFIHLEEMFLVPEYYNTPEPMTAEYDIITRIKANEEGYFDFSKGMIDIGAYIGAYSNLLDFSHQYCFEPNKEAIAILLMNAYLREKVKTTDVFPICLSDKEGNIKYNGYCCEEGGSPDVEREDLYGEMHDVETKTLDSFSLKYIGFIKIDVEGLEEKVLRGGLLTIISNDYPPILFECWNVGFYNMTQEKRDSLFNLLRTLGYEIFEYWGDYETHLAVHKSHLLNK